MRLFRRIPVLLLTAMGCLVRGQVQKPMANAHQNVKFDVREQSPDLCDAGSRYWTGTVNITSEKSMFFCEQLLPLLLLMVLTYHTNTV